ncbi:MAG: hypothetical protein Q7S48_00680 [bacterium]|nr:hypothetical protein [bacterium]
MRKNIVALGFIITAFGLFLNTALAQSEPSLRLFIISPSPGEVIQGKEVKVIVRLPAKITRDEYHVHLWLDALPEHENELSVVLEDIPEYTYTDVFSGLHTIYAEVYRNNHVALAERMFTQVEFETNDEELKPATDPDGQTQPPSDGGGGLWMPQGSRNTILSLALIFIVIGLLWYIFGRQKKNRA